MKKVEHLIIWWILLEFSGILEVEMLGETSNFNNPHFFSAAKVDGKWYYVDSCYNDIYVECMQRNRVETDGNMTPFLFLSK